MSALPPRTDIIGIGIDVRQVPQADLLRVQTSPPHLGRDCEHANSIDRGKSTRKSDQPTHISSLLSSERRKLRNHSVRATTGTEWLRAEDSRLQQMRREMMTSRTPRTNLYAPKTLAVMDQAFTAIWNVLKADDSFRDYARDGELRIAVGQKLLNLVADGVTDPGRLRQLTVESLLPGHWRAEIGSRPHSGS